MSKKEQTPNTEAEASAIKEIENASHEVDLLTKVVDFITTMFHEERKEEGERESLIH